MKKLLIAVALVSLTGCAELKTCFHTPKPNRPCVYDLCEKCDSMNHIVSYTGTNRLYNVRCDEGHTSVRESYWSLF